MIATAIWAIFNRFGHIFTLDPRFDWGRPPLLLSVNHQHGAKFRSVNMRVLLLIRSLDASFVTCERRMRLQSGMSDLRSRLGQFREKVRWFLWGQLHPKPKLRSDYGFEQKTLPDFSHSVKSRNIRERAKEWRVRKKAAKQSILPKVLPLWDFNNGSRFRTRGLGSSPFQWGPMQMSSRENQTNLQRIFWGPTRKIEMRLNSVHFFDKSYQNHPAIERHLSRK